MSIQDSGGKVPFYRDISHAASLGVKEMQAIEHMSKVEQHIEKLAVPTDYTSSTFLESLEEMHADSKGAPLTSNTKGVKEFFSGDAAKYPNFISSVKQAQRNL